RCSGEGYVAVYGRHRGRAPGGGGRSASAGGSGDAIPRPGWGDCHEARAGVPYCRRIFWIRKHLLTRTSMPGAPIRIGKAAWHLLPAPVRRKLRSEPGMRFMRFVPVSLAALASSQITLALLVGVARMSAGTSALVASIAGAAVSYVLSRWAWER